MASTTMSTAWTPLTRNARPGRHGAPKQQRRGAVVPRPSPSPAHLSHLSHLHHARAVTATPAAASPPAASRALAAALASLLVSATTPLNAAALEALSPTPTPTPTTVVDLPTPAARQAPLTREEAATVDLFRRASRGVVWVTSLTPRTDVLTQAVQDMPQGSGSGVIWDAAGHVVTNAHVVRGAAAVSVTFQGGKEYRARIVGTDNDKDVAVLEVLGVDDPADRAALFTPIPLGTSTGLAVGQRAYAIGNPFGLERSFTSGMISGIGREVPSGVTSRPVKMIQVEASINPGNSGGSLLDSRGSLIGIPTAIYSASGTSAGVGFAVPVDTVAASANAIIRTGKVVRPMLGISLAPEPAADGLGVKGVLVLGVQPDGAAAAAGLRPTSRDEYGRPLYGDIIRGFNGAKVETPADLYRALDELQPGDEVPVRVLRGSGEETVVVKLQASA